MVDPKRISKWQIALVIPWGRQIIVLIWWFFTCRLRKYPIILTELYITNPQIRAFGDDFPYSPQFPRTSHWGRTPILLYHISQTPMALVLKRCQGARNITEVQPSLLGFAATFGQQTSPQRGWPSRKGQIPLKQPFNLCWNKNNNDNKWINGYPQENRKANFTTMIPLC